MRDRGGTTRVANEGISAAGSFQADDWRGPSAPVVKVERRRRPRSDAPPSASSSLASEQTRADAIIAGAKAALRDQFARVRLGGSLDTGLLTRTTHEISGSMRRNKFAIIGLTRLRDRHEYTYVHSVAVCALMIGLARELRMAEDEVEALGLAGLLHDIGKARVPLELLDKPGPLTPDEWSTVMTHPERGHAILSRLPDVQEIVLDVALHHHERIDGTGYPAKLAGEGISIHARIAAICDVYDALTSKRAYKDGRPAAEALEWMRKATGHFDQRLLTAFRTLVGMFPAGTLVRLQHGRLGVVLNEPAGDPLNPRVRTFHCALMRQSLPLAICDTASDPIVSIERSDDWKLADWATLGPELMAPPTPAAV